MTLTVLIAATAGCADPDAGSPSAAGGSPASGPGRSTGLPLEFSRTGGFVGVDDHTSIGSDGSITVGAGASRPLDAATLARLNELLAAIPPAGPVPASSDGGVCADGYRYWVSTPSWSIVADDCALRSQPALAPLVQLLTPSSRDTAAPPSSTASPR